MKDIRYVIVNKSDNYNEIMSFKTQDEAKKKLKDLRDFDKRMGNPHNDEYIIVREIYDTKTRRLISRRESNN